MGSNPRQSAAAAAELGGWAGNVRACLEDRPRELAPSPLCALTLLQSQRGRVLLLRS